MPKPGDLLEHIHSKNTYWYVGDVPQRNTPVIVHYDKGMAGESYIIEKQELKQYYKVIDPPTLMVEGGTYNNKISKASFHVEKIFKNPETDKLTAFGWYKREPDYTKAHPYIIVEEYFRNWTLDK